MLVKPLSFCCGVATTLLLLFVHQSCHVLHVLQTSTARNTHEPFVAASQTVVDIENGPSEPYPIGSLVSNATFGVGVTLGGKFSID